MCVLQKLSATAYIHELTRIAGLGRIRFGQKKIFDVFIENSRKICAKYFGEETRSRPKIFGCACESSIAVYLILLPDCCSAVQDLT